MLENPAVWICFVGLLQCVNESIVCVSEVGTVLMVRASQQAIQSSNVILLDGLDVHVYCIQMYSYIMVYASRLLLDWHMSFHAQQRPG